MLRLFLHGIERLYNYKKEKLQGNPGSANIERIYMKSRRNKAKVVLEVKREGYSIFDTLWG